MFDKLPNEIKNIIFKINKEEALLNKNKKLFNMVLFEIIFQKYNKPSEINELYIIKIVNY